MKEKIELYQYTCDRCGYKSMNAIDSFSIPVDGSLDFSVSIKGNITKVLEFDMCPICKSILLRCLLLDRLDPNLITRLKKEMPGIKIKEVNS